MSAIPSFLDVLPLDEKVLDLPDVAQRLGVPVTRVHQMLRDRALLAVTRDDIIVVPELFLDGNQPNRHLTGLISVLRDGGYREGEILNWLFTNDDSFPGRPVDMLHTQQAREVVRRAQSMAF